MIPFGDPSASYQAHKSGIDQAIKRVLNSGWYVLGTEVEAFEKEFAAFHGKDFNEGAACYHPMNKSRTSPFLLVAERYVAAKLKDMIHDIIGRIDYESNTKFLELKTKPSKCYKRRNKDEYYWKQQELGEDLIFDGYWKQVAFYWKCTGKKPFLGLANETDYLIFDDTHEKMKADHLEYQFNLMTKKIYRWEQMIIYCKGNLSQLAELTEEPDLNHFFHYKNLTDKQRQIIKQLWGINA